MEKVKNKAKVTVITTKRMTKNLEEMLNAVSLTACILFAGYSAYLQRTTGFLWLLLGVSAAWATFQAFKAWGQFLNK